MHPGKPRQMVGIRSHRLHWQFAYLLLNSGLTNNRTCTGTREGPIPTQSKQSCVSLKSTTTKKPPKGRIRSTVAFQIRLPPASPTALNNSGSHE